MHISSSEEASYIPCSWDDKTMSTTGTFPLNFPETATKCGIEIDLIWLVRKVCKKRCLRDRLLRFTDFSWTTLIAFRFLLPVPNCFLRICLPTFFTAVLTFFNTNNICNFWHSEVQQVSTHTLCSLEDILTQKGSAVLAITCAEALNRHPCCLPKPP